MPLHVDAEHAPFATNRLRLFAAVDALELRRERLRLLPELSVFLVVAEDEESKAQFTAIQERARPARDGRRKQRGRTDWSPLINGINPA